MYQNYGHSDASGQQTAKFSFPFFSSIFLFANMRSFRALKGAKQQLLEASEFVHEFAESNSNCSMSFGCSEIPLQPNPEHFHSDGLSGETLQTETFRDWRSHTSRFANRTFRFESGTSDSVQSETLGVRCH